MKNLKLYSEVTLELGLQSQGENVTLAAMDVEQNRMFYASTSNSIYILHLHGKDQSKNSTYLPMVSILEPEDSITAMDYLIEKEALIVGTSHGYILLLTVDSDETTEVVGRVEGGVKSICCSPDGAVLSVAAGNGQLLVMTQDWDVLYETMLEHPQKTDISGKAYVDVTDGSTDSTEIQVSWRGDGKYFASLTGSKDSSSLQQVKIWERETGSLHSSSEYKAFMGACLDWMPTGVKVAAAYDRKADDKCALIVFFERNGLERGSFSIDDPKESTIEMLKWNCSSELLAALIRCEGHDSIKIWSFSNNHWYLKQELRYPKRDRVKFFWDPTKPLHLISWTLSAKIASYNFIWVTSVSDNAVALVIDSANVLLSPLCLSLIPPPFSLFNLKFPCSVQDKSFFCKDSKSCLAVSMSDGNLGVVELPVMDVWEEMENKVFPVDTCCSDTIIGTLRHLTWLDSHVLLGVLHCESSEPNSSIEFSFMENNGISLSQGQEHSFGYSLQEIELVCSENSVSNLVTSSNWQAKITQRIFLKRSIVAIVPNPLSKCSAFIQFDGGFLAEYSSKSGMKMASREILRGFPSTCPWMNAIPVSDNGTLKHLIFGLDLDGRLYVNDKILCENCTSFSFYSSASGIMQQVVTHIVFTTKHDFLYVMAMDELLSLESHGHGSSKIYEVGDQDGIKIWERGAKVIGVIDGDEAAIIIQTLRGNLECIYPRKLVLLATVNALVEGRFKDAMLMVRRQRLDFNIIVDYCGWQEFLQKAVEFVKQVNNLSHITDFICSIKNENVMGSLYKNALLPLYPPGSKTVDVEDSKVESVNNKVTSVLEAIQLALEEQLPESPTRELCILTTLARRLPPALEEALKRIKKIREMELSASLDEIGSAQRKSLPSAEEALKHLLWLSDSDAVFEAALGLYDLNLAAIVALNSQRDPKEFLPFLKELESMPPALMLYTIDLRLHRFEKALGNIVSAGDAYFEDCLNLIRNNPKLFPLALQLFTDLSNRKKVFEAWGDHLSREESFEDAAMAYLGCLNLEKALKAYRACGNWRGLLAVAGLLKLGEEEILQLAKELCEELQAMGKPAEAAKIAVEYCGDIQSGVGYFVAAREWNEALRIGFLHKREDLLMEVKNAALECASSLVSEYVEGVEKVGKYLTRYLAVRQRRLALTVKLQLEGRSADDDDIDDNASETSSSFSGMSAYTLRKGKGSGASISSSTASKASERRRQRHRGGKIRAGSPGEEIALLDHLKGMLLTPGAQCELRTLLNALLMLGEEGPARKLQCSADTFQVTQMASAKLAEDRMLDESLKEENHSLEPYVHRVRASGLYPEAFLWQLKVLCPP
ncbi:hypothetical protein AMTRI_Chr08g163090 [Amborella trichopoda]